MQSKFRLNVVGVSLSANLLIMIILLKLSFIIKFHRLIQQLSLRTDLTLSLSAICYSTMTFLSRLILEHFFWILIPHSRKRARFHLKSLPTVDTAKDLFKYSTEGKNIRTSETKEK